ncbi:MAG TPA: T9SS type A sorting domain-containing protein, partial [Mucilaginibacter sp.]|nr:T9SS type A sorting domain-containing protein [Mucilaginibacter sp.]
TASAINGSPHVVTQWKTVNEENYTNFTVERSTDGGKTFTIVGGLWATGAGQYSLTDNNPAPGTNYYRLRQQDINNNISYSNSVAIQYANTNSIVSHNLSIYPNPASSTVTLAISSKDSDSGIYNIRFVSSTGLVVREEVSSQTSWQGNISNLLPGTYIVKVMNNKTQTFVGESKLIKL